MRAREIGFGSVKRKSEGSDEDAEDISDSVSEGSTGRAEIAKVIGGFFSGADEERNDGCDGNGVAAEERV
ncbi:hypothetical protein TSUD_114330 [Trifolium subterraneum]|uniref:Uncharacterized protein n=1 Tax=Trifolium subterraneum TaxID=3900 RepID=A0A2Z6MCP5_TRISU|nr:hypothetical protein TSUD_114330 [Trifolium subterraneum]